MHTNLRQDKWGGNYENRMRFAIENIKAVRQAVGKHFIIIYRLSIIDLVEQGSNWPEIIQLAQAVDHAGATLINLEISLHEVSIPTVTASVPVLLSVGALKN